MSTWVDCTASSSYFGGFACDMGPYIGPWPLLPPGEMGGLDPTHSDEVDFYVALPNPADTTDVTIAADASYDTPLWDAYRYLTGTGLETSFGYYGRWTGPGAASPVPATPPAGVHLYVVAYAGSPNAAPPNPPEFYVPPSYAAGGVAALETAMGHWTTDQATYDTARTVFQTGFANPLAGIEHRVHADQDVPTEVNALIATILAGPPDDFITDFNKIAATKNPVGAGFAIPESASAVAADVWIAHHDGTSALAAGPSNPPALGALVYGVDYVDSPYIDAGGNDGPDYRFTGGTTWDWGLGLTTGPIGDAVSHEEFAPIVDAPPDATLPPDADNTPLGLKSRVAWDSGDTTGTPTWVSSGTVIGDFLAVDEAPITLSPPNLVFDYSPITDLSFTLHIAPKFLYDGFVEGLTDFAMPTDTSKFSSFIDRIVFFPGNPQLMIHSGPWQYWVPGAIVSTSNVVGYWGVPA